MSQSRETADDLLRDAPEAIDLADAPEEDRPRRTMRRLAANPIVRRLSPRKLLIGLGIGLAVVMTTGYVGLRLVRGAVAWLHARPTYQLPFEEMILDPPPPPWVRSGASGLLRQVHARSRWRNEPTLPVLDVDLGELADAFALGSPWVREVRAIERGFPNRLTVRLVYREPVAKITFGSGTASRATFLDGDGVVLPPDDLDLDRAQPLVPLKLMLPESGSVLEKPGLALAIEPKDEGVAPPRVARDACRLAAFLKARGAVAGTGTNRSPLLVELIQENPSGLWIQTVEDALILWRAAPGLDAREPRSSEQKWDLLMPWLQRHRLEQIHFPLYLRFEADGVRVYEGDSELQAGSIDP